MQRRAALLSTYLLSTIGVGAAAQISRPVWPSKPLRIIVVYPAGGVSDQVCRVIAEKLSALLQTAVRVENRAGASGSVGMEHLANAAPDGYTLAFSAITPLTILPLLGAVAYDPVSDFAPVVGVMNTPLLLIGTTAFQGQRFQDVLNMTQNNARELRWATSGVGTTGHIALELIRAATGIEFVHIPYKGGGQQIHDALSGQFELLSTNVASGQLKLIEERKFKPLAVGAPTRLKRLPQVPTFMELGLPKANLSSAFGIFAPARTPSHILRRLNFELNKVLAEPDVRSLLLGMDNIPLGGTMEKFSSLIAQEAKDHEHIAMLIRSSKR
jgi:tripartite-type tricarboxylate transporter receptor subunit TctC